MQTGNMPMTALNSYEQAVLVQRLLVTPAATREEMAKQLYIGWEDVERIEIRLNLLMKGIDNQIPTNANE